MFSVHASRFVAALAFVFLAGWCVDGRAAILPGQNAEWFMPSLITADQFFNQNLAMVGSALSIVAVIFQVPVVKDGHDCIVDSAQINLKIGGDIYVSWNRVY